MAYLENTPFFPVWLQVSSKVYQSWDFQFEWQWGSTVNCGFFCETKVKYKKSWITDVQICRLWNFRTNKLFLLSIWSVKQNQRMFSRLLSSQNSVSLYFIKNIYLVLEGREGREKERARNVDVWEKHPLAACYTPQPGAWPKTQACCPDWELNRDPLVRRPTLNPLSHTSKSSILQY